MAKSPLNHTESDHQSTEEISSLSIVAFRSFLLAWYNENSRHLPWRETHDPYCIWVSEIILQQTQVVQGYDYYLRFIDKYPTVADLAHADEDELMLLWQGLGYYSRAHNMKVAAGQVMDEFGGVFPTTPEDVRSLKGVGPYTTAAIMSIAYDYPLAVVDGNVYRILSRLLSSEIPIDTTEGIRFYAQTAQKMLDTEHPGLYNQAMMDLGATVCTPKSPSCLICPVHSICASKGTELIQILPIKAKKTAVTDRYLDYFLIYQDGHVIVERRGKTGIWKGLYQFPLLAHDTAWASETEMDDYIGNNLTISETVELPLHRLTHRLLHIRVHICTPTESYTPPPSTQLMAVSAHPTLSFPKPLRAFLDTHFPA